MMKSYLFLIIAIIPSLIWGETTNSPFKNKVNSVFEKGKWIKIAVTQSGIHKIPYATLKEWGFSDPSKVNLFGSGGNMLPEEISKTKFIDPEENYILHSNNAIYFYAQGPTQWEYNSNFGMFVHQMHNYTNNAYYFLTDDQGEGRRISSISSDPNYNTITNEYDSYQFHESNLENLLKSGREWYGEYFKQNNSTLTINFNIPNLVTSEKIKLKTNLVARSNASTRFNIYTNDDSSPVKSFNITSVAKYNDTEGDYALQNSEYSPTLFYGKKGDNSIKIEFTKTSDNSEAWLNYICINAKQTINLDNKSQLSIRNIDVTGSGLTTLFQAELGNNLVWDVTSHTAPVSIEKIVNGFTAKTDILKEFVIFNPNGNLPTPALIGNVANQNLKGMSTPEMLIITYPDFIKQAEALASLHWEHSKLETAIVTLDKIYNEFSSGQPDITAIRNFNKYLYDKNEGYKLLLLFGDGSYQNHSSNNKSKIITYQSENSIAYNKSYVSDDYFGILEDHEGVRILEEDLEIGIGRLPADSKEEAETLVSKIETYLLYNQDGKWKSELTFIADDIDVKTDKNHIINAKAHIDYVKNNYPDFEINEIFLDAFPQVSSASGEKYPEVNEIIAKTLDEGTLLVNYTGHGSPSGLAHEQILTLNDINKWTNFNRLPLFVTATCEFSPYDHDGEKSAGERILLSPHGGGIAMFTTTRIAWIDENKRINDELLEHLFRQHEDGSKLTFGEITKHTKNESGKNTVNNRQFTLLGDPALSLAYPEYKVKTSSINDKNFENFQDTLKAISYNTIKGEINNESGKFNNGKVNVIIYDKEVAINTLGNGGAKLLEDIDKENAFSYNSFENIIYTGEAELKQGQFSFEFIIPKDIRYNIGEGRLFYYATSEEGYDAFGSDVVLIGDIANNSILDITGPSLSIDANGSYFSNGTKLNNRPILYIELEDENGINTSGIGIGHDITLTIDNDRTNAIILNKEYTTAKNNFKKGSITFQLPQLAEGDHTLQLKAWDNFNNSSSKEIYFTIDTEEELDIYYAELSSTIIKPGESIVIEFEHDAPNAYLDVTSRIFNLNGQLVDERTDNLPSLGNRTTPLVWKPNANLSEGMYIVHYLISAEDGQTGYIAKKIIISQ